MQELKKIKYWLACIDAYLTPCINVYLRSFQASFSGDVNVLFMQSDGGLTSLQQW